MSKMTYFSVTLQATGDPDVMAHILGWSNVRVWSNTVCSFWTVPFLW